MGNTRVRVQVAFEDCVKTAGGDVIGEASQAGDGCFQIDFDSSMSMDIDTNEAALTRACAPALRDALRARLAHVAKKRALREAAGSLNEWGAQLFHSTAGSFAAGSAHSRDVVSWSTLCGKS